MGIQGNLSLMTISDLIQHTCQDRSTAELKIMHQNQTALLYFQDGNIVHAQKDGLIGEKVVYEILKWDDGEFSLDKIVKTPAKTIERSWSSLLLEGARRLDEDEKNSNKQKFLEDKSMATKKKSELLAETLADVIDNSTDIEGAAVVGIDGLVYSVNAPVGHLDDTLIGAVAAAALGLSKRSVEQLSRGTFTQSLIQADRGNIVVSQINPETLFIALTSHGVNLGMVFAETRKSVATLREIL